MFETSREFVHTGTCIVYNNNIIVIIVVGKPSSFGFGFLTQFIHRSIAFKYFLKKKNAAAAVDLRREMNKMTNETRRVQRPTSVCVCI